MPEFFVREAREEDSFTRQLLLEAATQELRQLYRPRVQERGCRSTPTGILVAVIRDVVLGTTEYVIRDTDVYLQGIAVHPESRKKGVCRALVAKAETLAQEAQVSAIALCVIEETGNVIVFEKLGFEVTSCAVASGYESASGSAVTRVDMERRIA